MAKTFTGMGGHHSRKSATVEWLTPPSIIAALGGSLSFDLDPCAPARQPWPTARRTFTARDDGLLRPWVGRVWLNPPYGDEVALWLAKMAEHARGTALIFARTETDAFFRSVWERATALLFMRGRVNFHHADGARAKKNAGAPTVLCAYGMDDADVLAACEIAGQFVPLRFPRSVLVEAVRARTWAELIMSWAADREFVDLQDLYRLARAHPKAAGNRHVEAKVRQQVQQLGLPLGGGRWKIA